LALNDVLFKVEIEEVVIMLQRRSVP
jgi:hypothetical protein